MMEVCRRNGYINNTNGSTHHHNSTTTPQAVIANFVPSSNGNVTLTFNNQLTNQVPRIMRERTVAAPPPAPPPHSFDNLVSDEWFVWNIFVLKRMTKYRISFSINCITAEL